VVDCRNGRRRQCGLGSELCRHLGQSDYKNALEGGGLILPVCRPYFR
jgi:hypothetical protein